jgi:bla regulator protein blaR1
MKETLQHIFPQRIAQALCHLLVSSLWEGLLLAFLTGLIILLTRKERAAWRYRLLVSTLVLYTIVVGVSLVGALNDPTGGLTLPAALVPAEAPNFLRPLLVSVGPLLLFFDHLLERAHEYAGIISGLWLLIAGLQNLRLIFGLYTQNRLKHVRVKRAASYWQKRTNRLRQLLGIREAVILLESAIVKIPMIIGYLKPVILVPIGFLNSLEPAQVEAILLHELAHIRRKDWLVNILQTILETLFFFNPAVLWLSRLIRTERENCCDDIVIARTNNPIGYAEALVHFEEYRLHSPRKAIALIGCSGSVLGRLERIVNSRNRSLSKPELIVLAVLLWLSTVFIAAGSVPAAGAISAAGAIPAGNDSNNAAFQAKKKAEAEAADRLRHQHHNP